MRNYKNLDVWKLSHQNALEVYELANNLPKSESFGLVSQVRRAALSIPCNIAEGCGMATVPNYTRYLTIARGSAFELEYQLIFAVDSGMLSAIQAEACITRTVSIQKMLYSLIGRLSKE